MGPLVAALLAAVPLALAAPAARSPLGASAHRFFSQVPRPFRAALDSYLAHGDPVRLRAEIALLNRDRPALATGSQTAADRSLSQPVEDLIARAEDRDFSALQALAAAEAALDPYVLRSAGVDLRSQIARSASEDERRELAAKMERWAAALAENGRQEPPDPFDITHAYTDQEAKTMAASMPLLQKGAGRGRGKPRAIIVSRHDGNSFSTQTQDSVVVRFADRTAAVNFLRDFWVGIGVDRMAKELPDGLLEQNTIRGIRSSVDHDGKRWRVWINGNWDALSPAAWGWLKTRTVLKGPAPA